MTVIGLTTYAESAKGECNLGQHEIAFRYTDALRTADQHSIYKTGAKEIAAGHPALDAQRRPVPDQAQ